MMEITPDEPKDHEHFRDGSYYKVIERGGHKIVMLWNNKDWHKSGKTLKELLKKSPKPPRSGPKNKKTGPFTYEVILGLFQKIGPMSRIELLEEGGLKGIKSTSVDGALKTLVAKHLISYSRKEGVYSEPCSIQNEFFRGLKL